MSAARDAVRLVFAGEGANVEPHLGEGWHAAEAGHRWTDGFESVLRLPPLRPQPWFAVTLHGFALDTRGFTPTPTLTLRLNGAVIRREQRLAGLPMAFALPGALVRADAENFLVLEHPIAARPREFRPDNGDARLLSLGLLRLEVEPLGAPLHPAPRLIARGPAPDAPAHKEIASAFQSLGQSCDLGNFQRRYGAEPFGLLRFAGISPAQLLHGLRTRFAGMGDADKLSFYNHDDSRELQGRHAVYGLNYHTFKWVDETDVAALIATESKRLAYLARLFFEQLENDEKIFVRAEHFETLEEALALHLLLCAYNPRARLLLLQAALPGQLERVGRVVELRPRLYRGYVSTMNDPARDPPRPLHEEWMQVCAAVVADQGRAGDLPGTG